MLGIILNTVRAWVLAHYNQKKWDEILAASGHSGVDFTTHVAYDEKILYDLVGACVKLLNMPTNQVVEAVGYHFVIFIKGTPYAKMLAIAGNRFTDLLKNLNALHGHMVASHFKNMKSPTFRVVQEQDGRAVFFYTPGSKERVGLGPLVIGLIRAVAELQFGITSLSIQQLKTLEDGTIEFSMEWDDDSEDDSEDTVELQKYDIGLTPTAFVRAFPFHVVLDITMRVAQVGPSMAKLVPGLVVGSMLMEHFSVVQPADLDLKNFKKVRLASESSMVSMVHMPPMESNGHAKDPIQMKGQFLYSRGKKLMYFLGSPEITSIDAATRMGLTLADFAVHDPAKDILFMADAKEMSFMDEARRKKVASRRQLKKKDSKTNATLPSFAKATASSPSAPSIPTSPMTAPLRPNFDLKLNLSEINTSSAGVEQNLTLEQMLRFIFVSRLGLDIQQAENVFAECLYILKSNLILNLNSLLKLPSAAFLERLKLPLLVETELMRIMQNPDSIIQAFGVTAVDPVSGRSTSTKVMGRSSSRNNLANGSLEDSESPRTRSFTFSSNDKSALFGLTDEMRAALKTSWAEISQPKAGSGSQLNVFFDNLSKELATVDAAAASVFDGQSLQNQSDSLMGLMGVLTRTLDDPMKTLSTIRQPAVRFMILGFDRQKFQSLATSIAAAIGKTLGRVSPTLSETWFTFAKSVFELVLNEYDIIRTGMAGKVYKMNGGQKWKLFYTLMTHDRLILYRDTALTDKKEEFNLTSIEHVDTHDTEVSSQPTPFLFYFESGSGTRTMLAAENENSMNHWISELTRRIRAWSFVNQRKK